ncbi:MAG: hypothetical protein J6V21_06600 [Alistipes sp.]|nr:hypothetical protein [Alistipes sp.]
MNKLYNWLSVSNRSWHLLCVYVVSLFLGWASGITAIACLEFKDVLHTKNIKAWDWVDVIAGLIGCIIGGAIHWVILKHW